MGEEERSSSDPVKIRKIKKKTNETVQDYIIRFNEAYNDVPQNLRPPHDSVLVKFPDGFDSDIAYSLRERAPQTLEEMQSIVVSVETNLIEKRARARAERRMPLNEEPSAFENKLDAIIKGMERLGDRVETIERKSTSDNIVRNPNFRRNQNQNIGKNVPDQNIRPPFQENFVEGSTSKEPT